ncbi:pyrimidine transporter [Escherichia coli]|nr:pyrimidine transporter [Escherichia coli]
MAMFGFPHWQLKSTSTESGVVRRMNDCRLLRRQ